MTSPKPSPKRKARSSPNDEKFRLIFENHPVPMWVYERQTLAFLEVNDAAVEKYGYTRDEFLAMTIKDIRPAEDVSRLLKDVKKKRPALQQSGEWRHRLKDGRVIDVEITSHTLEFKGRQAVLVMAQDVTERKQAEAALAESETRLRAILESEPECVKLLDSSCTVLDMNPAGLAMIEADSLEQVNGKSILNIVAQDYRAAFEALNKRVFAGETGVLEFEIVGLKGSRRWLETHAVPLRNVQGAVTAQLGLTRDITARKRAELALRDSEERYRFLFANNPLPMWVYDEETLAFLAVNETAVQYYGYSREEFLAMTIRDIRPTDDLPRFDAYNSGGHIIPKSSGTWRHLKKDGSIIDVEITSHSLIFDGKSAKLILVNDITERKRAEEALRESEERFRGLFDNATIGMYRTTPNGRILLSNSAALHMLGYDSFEELAKRNLEEQGFESDYSRGQFRERMEQEGIVIGLESAWKRKDGSTIYVRESAIAVRDEKGNIRYYDGTFEDVTERKQAEVTLQRQLQELTLLQAVSTHAANAASEDDLLAQVTSLIGKTFYPDNFGFLLMSEDYASLLTHSSYRGITPENIPQKVPLWTGIVGRVAASGKPLRIADVRGEENYIDVNPATRSELCVPMTVGERVLGVINTESREVDAFSEADERLLSTLAGQTANALDRIRSAAAEHEQRVLAEALRDTASAVNSTLDFDQVLDRILENVGRVVPNQSASIMMIVEDSTRVIRHRGYNERGLGEWLNEVSFNKKETYSIRRLVETRQSLLISDTHADPNWIILPETAWIRSYVAAPIHLDGNVIGLINIDHDIPGFFTPVHAERLLAFADQVAIAMQNARLFEETRQRLAELGMLYESGLALSQLLSPKEIAQKIIDLLERKLNWHHTAIRLHHPEDETLELLAFHLPHITSEADRLAMETHFKTMVGHTGQGLSGWAVQHGESVRIGDLTTDARYVETFPGLQSGLYVPIKLGDRVIGVISIESGQANVFSEADQRLTTTLANQAAIALENARLFEERARRTQEFASLYETSNALSAEHDLNTLLRVIVEHAKTLLHAASSDTYLYDMEREELEMVLSTSPTAPIGTRLRFGEGMAGRVAQSRQPLRIADYSTWEGRSPKYEGVPYRAILEVPMLYGGELIGVLTANEIGDSERQFTEADERLLSLFASQAAGAIHSARLREETVRRLKHLESLRAIDNAISGSKEVGLILEVILQQVVSQLGADAAVILLLDRAEQVLEYASGRGFRTDALQYTRLPLGQGYAGRAALGRQLVQIQDLRTRQTDFLRSPTFSLEGFVSYFGVPLIAKGEIEGVLEVFHRVPFEATTEWLNFLETLAGQTAIAIDNATLYKGLQLSNVELMLAYDATIEGWSHALDLKDKETEGHTQRVTKITMELAQAMGISKAEIVHIRRGALLHDIGKMGVPDSILLKPGKLTEEEWVIMRRHPAYAYEMLSPIAYLKSALDIPYCHHEKWDGTGYPRGLKGEQIPLAARIFAVVDVWDALTSNRPYRGAWNTENTLEYIREQSGRYFDPQVVKKFMEIFMSDKG